MGGAALGGKENPNCELTGDTGTELPFKILEVKTNRIFVPSPTKGSKS